MGKTFKDTDKYKDHIAKQTKCSKCEVGGIPSDWKRLRKRIRKAKEREALINGFEIPIFKNSDGYDYW